jgi:hypothetical protein
MKTIVDANGSKFHKLTRMKGDATTRSKRFQVGSRCALIVLFVVQALILTLPGQPALAAGPRCYVKYDASGANNGSSWTDAYTSLQSALGDAGCTEIWVAEGVYKPTTNPSDRGATFELKSNLALYGGFAGTESSIDERNIDAHPTVLSGDIDNNDSQTPVITDITTVTGNTTNSEHVLNGSDVSNVTIDGFTITAGYSSPDMYATGGGINFHSPYGTPLSLNLANLDISGNYAVYSGGGIYTDFTVTTMNNVAFNSNSAGEGGGGFYQALSNIDGGTGEFQGGSPSSLTDVTFTGNIARLGGGAFDYLGDNAVYTHVQFINNIAGSGLAQGGGLLIQGMEGGTGPTLNDVTFTGNQATWGGGLYLLESTGAVINDSVFSGNTATGYSSTEGWGGGLAIDHSNPALNRVAIRGNTANTTGSYAEGGGIAIQNSSDIGASFTNVLISGNTSIDGAAFDAMATENIVFQNVTITGNRSYASNVMGYSFGGVLLEGYSSSPTTIQVTNTIVYGNKNYSGSDSDQFVLDSWSSGVITNSILANGCPSGATCTNVTSSDPQFVTPIDPSSAPTTAGDLHLQTGSPAIDTGTNTGCPSTDLDGVSRPVDGNSDGTETCDIGAYEYFLPRLYAAPSAVGTGDCHRWAGQQRRVHRQRCLPRCHR